MEIGNLLVQLTDCNSMHNIYQQCGEQRVYLRHKNSAISPVGIYHCGIPTDADISVRATVYVELYTASGGRLSHPFVQSF